MIRTGLNRAEEGIPDQMGGFFCGKCGASVARDSGRCWRCGVLLHGLGRGTEADRRNLQSEFWRQFYSGVRDFFANHWKGIFIPVALLAVLICAAYFVGFVFSRFSPHSRHLWSWLVVCIPPALVLVPYFIVLIVEFFIRLIGGRQRVWKDMDHGALVGYIFLGLLAGVVLRYVCILCGLFYQHVSGFLL